MSRWRIMTAIVLTVLAVATIVSIVRQTQEFRDSELRLQQQSQYVSRLHDRLDLLTEQQRDDAKIRSRAQQRAFVCPDTALLQGFFTTTRGEVRILCVPKA